MDSMNGFLTLSRFKNQFVLQVVVARKENSSQSCREVVKRGSELPSLLVALAFTSFAHPTLPGGSGVWVQPALSGAHFRKAWMPFFFRTEGRDLVTAETFPGLVGSYLEQAGELELPVLTGENLYAAPLATHATSGGLDGWGWNVLKASPYLGL